MNSAFMHYFHNFIAEEGYPCLKFNFFYSEAGKKTPDPQPLLISCYEKAIEVMPYRRLVIGGKSMGGRISSYVAEQERIAGLFFLGYPLHPPGKENQLRDQHLYNIQKPMLFISGTRDPFARLDLLESTIKKIGPTASSFFVKDGGHSLEVPKRSGLSTAEILNSAAQDLLRWLTKNF